MTLPRPLVDKKGRSSSRRVLKRRKGADINESFASLILGAVSQQTPHFYTDNGKIWHAEQS